MNKFQKSFVIFVGLVIIGIIGIGSYYTIKLFSSVKKIKSEGIETIAVIQKKWRGKCGSGYGNSATFKMNINGRESVFISDCNVPNEVKEGDRYYVKYLKEDPSKNLILFEKRVKETKQ